MLIKTVYSLLIKNLHLKIISIILAFIVFLSVHISNNKNVIQSLNVDLSLSIPKSNMVVNNIPRKLSILVKGPLNEIKKIKKENISLPIKITKSKTIILNDYNLSLPKNIKVIEILPRTLNIVIEKIVEKRVPIQFNVINELPSGYKYDIKPKLSKKFVIIKGPKSSIDLLKKVYSEPLNQAKIIGSESQILKLKLESSLLRFKNTREVSISYKIKEEFITKVIKNIDIKLLNCDLDKNNIKPLKKKVKLIIKIPYSLKDKYSKNDFFVYADLKDCANYDYMTSIKLSPAVPHKKIIPQYISPDTIILKRTNKKDKITDNKHLQTFKKINHKKKQEIK